MLLPRFYWIEAWLERDFDKEIVKLTRAVTKKTLQNWRRPGTKARKSVWVKVNADIQIGTGRATSADDARTKAEELFATATTFAESAVPYVGEWEAALCMFDTPAIRESLPFRELRRLLDESEKLIPLYREQNFRGLAKALAKLDFPWPMLVDELIRELRNSKRPTKEDVNKTLFTICLTNTLYVMACIDADREVALLTTLCPTWTNTVIKMPMDRCISEIRRHNDLKSYAEVAKLLLPNASIESAKRELFHWRKHTKLPSWSQVKKWPEEMEWAMTYIRLLDRMYKVAEKSAGVLHTPDPEAIFRQVPALVASARERLSS